MKMFVLCRKANIAHRARRGKRAKNRQAAFSKSETTMSIRNILMSLSTGLAVLALSLSPAGPARAASADGARMDLPAPDKKGGMPFDEDVGR